MRDCILRKGPVAALLALLLLLIPAAAAFAGLASVSGVSPSSVQLGTDPVTAALAISGGGFLPGSVTVTFSDPTIVVNSATYISMNEIDVSVTLPPNAALGASDVTVDDNLAGTATCSGCFSATSSAPTLTGVSSGVGQGASGTVLTLTGTNFRKDATVSVSGLGVSAGTPVWSSTSSVSVPFTASAVAPTGARDITIQNADSKSSTCYGCLIVNPAPRATSFSPAQRGPGTSTTLQITGSGFEPGMTVAMSGTEITTGDVDVLSNSFATAPVSVANDAPLGAHDVTFTNPDGGTTTCAGCFHITGPTSATLTSPSALNGPVVATFTQPVSGITSNTFFVTVTGQSTKLASAIACTDGNGLATSCSSGSVVTANLRTASPLIAGQHYTATLSPVTDFGGLTVSGTTLDFRAGLVQEAENAVATTPTWRVVPTSSAFGGSFTIEHLANASAAYVFRGSWITWYTNIGPSYGIADLYVDGVRKAIVNSYSSTSHYRAAYTISGLTYHTHTLLIVVRGAKGSSHGTGTNVAVDAIKVGSTITSSPSLKYTWRRVNTSAAGGGAFCYTDEPGATSSFTFRGTQVSWITIVGPGMGRAWVYVDGVRKASVDNYAGATTYNVARTISGLSDAVHTIKIIVLGSHRSGATGSNVVVDRWIVG